MTATGRPIEVTPGTGFALHFLENEDEAQHTGYHFHVEPEEGEVFVRRTYHHHEYEELDPGCWMPIEVARKFWAKLMESGLYERVK